jgi:hypothetical protein
MLEKMKTDNNPRGAEIFRRLAANLYFVDNPPKPVTPDRLAAFLAAYPAWIQSTFLGCAPDEARRRLTIVYRLVFPYPDEIKPAAKAPAPAPGERAATSSGRPAGAPAGKTPGGSRESPF